MLVALATLLLFQLLGELCTSLFSLPIPGPVIGMALLLCFLLWRGQASEALKTTSTGLLQHLSLLFIPVGSGVLLHLDRLAEDALAIFGVLVISTVITLGSTALIFKWQQQRLSQHLNENEHDGTPR